MKSNEPGLRLGIVQGRLTKPPSGELQWFPQQQWEAEFSLAAGIGIDFIELIAEREHNPENPLWSESGAARIQEVARENGLSVHAFCNDFIIDHPLVGNRDVLEQNLRLLECGARLGCEKYILPLFEKSEMTGENCGEYTDPLMAIAERAAELGITICLETILGGAALTKAVDHLDRPNVGVVFDTGNRVAFGHDLASDIRLLGDRIRHVHIKDKNRDNQNVILGTGLVNFQTVFEALSDIGYSGPYTFETQRGRDPVRTAAYNVDLVQYFHAEGFSQ